MKREGGIELLNDADKEAANNLLDQLRDYGIFVVRRGEVESWLVQLGASGHGPDWLIKIFERMGEDPEAAGYLAPSSDDVWSFLGEIKQWLTNANRRGVPT
jgi:hypothetical protein